MFAVPDFAFGAMENWGSVTYKERRILVSQENTAAQEKLDVACVVSHELVI